MKAKELKSMIKHGYHKTVEITKHAMQRLEERVGSFKGFRSWQHMVNTARYKGKSEFNMTDEEFLWCEKHIRNLYKTSQIRILNGFAFLFMGNKGHARTLVTVIAVK